MADSPRLLDHVFVTVEGLTGPPEQELRAALVDVTVESSLHLPDVATLVVHDSGLRWVDEAKLEPGKALQVSAKGSESENEHPIFDGEIVEIEPDFVGGAQLLRVRAFDRLHRLARGRHVRSFVNVTDGDLVRKIAQELGLQASAESGGQVHEYVFQNNETNLEFLRGRATQRGCLLFVEGKTLHFDAPRADGEAVEVKWGDTLVEFYPRMTTVSQVTGATVRVSPISGAP
jgi:phage protein D